MQTPNNILHFHADNYNIVIKIGILTLTGAGRYDLICSKFESDQGEEEGMWMNSGARMWRPRAGEGHTESQSETCGRPREAILAISLVWPLRVQVFEEVGLDWLLRSTLRLSIFWETPTKD